MNVAAILLVTSVPWVIAGPAIGEKWEEAKREPLGLFESVTAWSNKIFPFQFLNGNEKVEDSKRLDAQKEYNEKGERIATSPLEKIFGKDNIFASMISNVIGTIGKAIEGIASNVQKGIGLPFFPNREIPTDADKSDSGHSKRYESREASVKEGGRRVGYRESTEGAKEVDGEKRAIHSTALDGDDAKTGGGERKRSDGPAVSTELGGEAKSWSHSSQGIEKNSLTSSKEESSRRSTNVDEKRRGGSEEVKDKVARESIEVKEEGKKAKEKVDAEGKRDKVKKEEKEGKDKVGEKTEKEKEVEGEKEETRERKEKKEVKEGEEKEEDKRKKKKD
ncbi:uncharacterized protein LOC107994187 isoform X2 [Apis cerana]|uniref:uncharacterized protein LOC107994187 isoform X2 n=1 Tax=Apis cerana TaxID=7461 RepID=UPI002B22360A|nr:uncharacterized protein LOC107994187 isoform X2 [Apis cerana]